MAKEYPYLLRTLKIGDEPEILEEKPAAELICPERFDLMAKLIYFKALDRNENFDRAHLLYQKHIESFQDFFIMEHGQNRKRGLQSFDSVACELFSYAKNAESSTVFDKPVPVDCQNIAMDGAHRISVACCLQKKIPVVRLTNFKAPYRYDYHFFRRRLLQEEFLVEMALEYTNWRNTVLIRTSHTQHLSHIERIVRKITSPACVWQDQNRMVYLLLDLNKTDPETVTQALKDACIAYSLFDDPTQIHEIISKCPIPKIHPKTVQSMLFSLKKAARRSYRIALFCANKLLGRAT